MPYHALLEAIEANPTIDVGACVAFAPDDLFDAFSYAGEHLPDDSAIASLLSCAVALRATAEQTEIGVQSALAWIDEEIARLWTARGVYPGLGSALTAFGLEHGSLLAHEIVRTGALSEQRQVVCVGRSTRRSKRRLGREGAPLGQRGGAPLFVSLAGDEMALLIEMVVDLGMN